MTAPVPASRGGGEAGVDVLLLFPGVTEARFFPYLSLPMLTGYLRAHKITVAQRDLNIELIERLCDPRLYDTRLGGSQRPGERGEYTRLLLEFVQEHAEQLRATAFGRSITDFPFPVAHQILRGVAEHLLDGSLLTARHRRLEALVEQAYVPTPPEDIATRVHEELVRDALQAHRPTVVGLSVAYFSQLGPALRVARQIRDECPDTRIILGGQQIMLRGDQLAALPGVFDLVDALCTGPGEQTLLEFVRRCGDIGPGRPLAGAITAHGRGTVSTHHIRNNPPPVFDGLPFHHYLADEPQLPAVSCVGCYWGRCVFCSYGNRSLNRRYQQLTAAQLAEHCAAGLDATGARQIVFVDENCNLRLLLKATTLLRERGYRFIWSSRNRMEPDLADPGFCRDLAQAGCRMMSVGYETCSQRLLDLMDKGVDASSYQRIVDNLHETGIALRFSVMGGLFDETPDEAEESRAFLVRNAAKIGIDVVQMLMVEPGTLLAGDPEAYGLAARDDGQLLANEEFSYLGGRVGAAYTFARGDAWHERAARLSKVVDTVFPGKNGERHPRFRALPPSRLHGVSTLRLFPWVVCDRGGGSLVDLYWVLTYRLPDDVTYDAAGHVLHARTARGRTVLDRLTHADLGTAQEPGDGPTGKEPTR